MTDEAMSPLRRRMIEDMTIRKLERFSDLLDRTEAKELTQETASALLDANDHALAVDVADLEGDHFGGAQTCAVSHAQRGLVFEPRRGIQQARHFLRAEHDRQLSGLWMNVVCSMMSDRLSVTLKKNRKAATA